MKKGFRYILLSTLGIIIFLGLTVLLSRTIFKDKLIEYAIKLNQDEQKLIQSYYVSDIPVEPENFAEDFKSIHDIVLENCPLSKHKGYDLDSIYNLFANRIANESITKAEYGLLLREYFAALKIGHADVMLTLHSAEYYPTIVENRLFVEKPNDHFTNNGFIDKDEIIAINNTPIDQYIESMAKYTSASTDAYKTHLTQCRIFTSFTDSLIYCDVRRNGDTLKLKLPLTSSILNNTPQAHYKILRDSIGYIGVESMMDNVVEDFKQAYNQICKLPYLIIDVRGNGGGNSNNGRLIAEYLLKNPQEHCVGDRITPQSNAYKGKLFLLYNYVYKLSGGEKRRLYLCTVLMSNPNFLVLDEPTNDLDIETLQVLEEYLSEFKGCVIVVSHDRYFMDKVVDHIFVFNGDGDIKDFPGNYTEYRDWRDEERAAAARAAATQAAKSAPAKQAHRTEEKRKLTFKEKREYEALEAEIFELEEEKAAIEQAMSSGTLPTADLLEKSARIQLVMELIDEKTMRWLELSEYAG